VVTTGEWLKRWIKSRLATCKASSGGGPRAPVKLAGMGSMGTSGNTRRRGAPHPRKPVPRTCTAGSHSCGRAYAPPSGASNSTLRPASPMRLRREPRPSRSVHHKCWHTRWHNTGSSQRVLGVLPRKFHRLRKHSIPAEHGDRTRQRRLTAPLTGFEDRARHQPGKPCRGPIYGPSRVGSRSVRCV